MKNFFQEEGNVVIVTLAILSLVGIITAITTGNNPLKDNIYNLLHSIPTPEE